MVLFGRCFGLFSLTVLEKREHIKKIKSSYLKRHSVPVHILKNEPQCKIMSWRIFLPFKISKIRRCHTWKRDWWRCVFFSVQKWVVRSSYISKYDGNILSLKSKSCFVYSTFLEQDWDVDLKLTGNGIFWLIIFDFRQSYRKKNIWELVRERLLLFILNDDQVHTTFLKEPITSNLTLRDVDLNLEEMVFFGRFFWMISVPEKSNVVNEVILLFFQFKNK